MNSPTPSAPIVNFPKPSRGRRSGKIYASASLVAIIFVIGFVVAAPLFTATTAPLTASPAAGTIQVRASAQLSANTTQTFTLTSQVFTGSSNCSSGAGLPTTVTGVNQATGYSISVGAGDSVLFTSAPKTEQSNEALPDLSGRFISWFIATHDGVTFPPTPDGTQVCVAGFEGTETREIRAAFAPTLQLYDSTCITQRTGLNPIFNPGETMCIKVLGGLTDAPVPNRYFVAGGAVNECTFLPGEGQSFNDFPIVSDPQTFSFAIPATDGDIPSYCSSSPTTTLIGSWRTGLVDSSGLRAVKRFVVDHPPDQLGVIKAASRAQFTDNTSQTFTLTTQVFSGSPDCSTGGGPESTVTGVNNTTGHTLSLGPGNSVLFTTAPLSEQSNETLPVPSIDLSGRFINWTLPIGQTSDGLSTPPNNQDGRKICIAGFEGPGTREVRANFAPTLQLFDSTCTTQKTGLNPVFNPGETMCIKIIGGLTDSAIPMRYFVAGGSVNECTFLPGAGQSFNDFPVHSDPQIFTFNIPASDADIPSHCSASPTTTLIGSWRTGVVGVSAEIRGVKRFMVQESTAAGTVRVKPRAQFTSRSTQTFTMTTQVFSGSMDCSSGGGAENTVTGIDRATGYSLNVGAGDSVLLTSELYSDQSRETLSEPIIDLSGRFIGWAIPFGQFTGNFTFPPSPDGRQICVAGFEGSFTRDVEASFVPTIQLYDSTCTVLKTGSNPEFAPGETICIKVIGGLTDHQIPFRYLIAGGSVNQCVFSPEVSLNDNPIPTDPYSFTFTFPDSDADIPPACVTANNTTSILGQWVFNVVGVSAEIRAQKRFLLVNHDLDDDDVINSADNCPAHFNPDQANNDGDSEGDVCDADDDNDGVVDTSDNCALTANANQLDTDGDSTGDACDTDDDGDGVLDVNDNCPLTANSDQLDTDADSIGDTCDPDDDGDFILDAIDNCPLTANSNQLDTDGDGTGDACDPLTYFFNGFFDPVENPPTVNVIAAGRGLAVKFSLGGDRGLNIFMAGSPSSQQMVCGGGLDENTVEETITVGNSSLSYNQATDTYTYMWKTDKAWRGTCRQLSLRLADGSTRVANFRFK